MQDRKKIVLLVTALVALVIAVIGGTIFYVKIAPSQTKSRPPIIQTDVSKSSELNGTSTTSKKDEVEVEATELTEFLGIYYTWDLTKESVNERSKALKNWLTPTCYESLAIEKDSEDLNEIIDVYDKTKVINTSNSTQLVDSQYKASRIYQDTSTSSIYIAEVTIEQKAPYSKEAAPTKKKLRISLENNKINQLKELSN